MALLENKGTLKMGIHNTPYIQLDMSLPSFFSTSGYQEEEFDDRIMALLVPRQCYVVRDSRPGRYLFEKEFSITRLTKALADYEYVVQVSMLKPRKLLLKIIK